MALIKKKIVYGLQDVESVAQRLAPYVDEYAVITLSGPIGAGKTTLVQALLRSQGVTEDITSPTFNYMNQYVGADGKTFYHFDLYRVASEDDFCAAGFEEYLYLPNSVALIEWPTVIKDLLDHSVCSLSLSYSKNELERVLSIACKE